jgi:TolB-like protein
MVEEIITALSRIRWLFVIARNSSFTYKGRAVDVKQVGRERQTTPYIPTGKPTAPTNRTTSVMLVGALEPKLFP